MKYLPIPGVNDVHSTTEMSENEALHRTSYPYLRMALPDILRGYQHYEDQGGNALNINPLLISDSLKMGLLKNYGAPPNVLSFIKNIRKSSPKVCPMCGSLKTTSLDHVLPKEDYPEFAVYSKNLVPACDCNTKRGTATKDTTTGVRVLHPYFDNCLSERQLSCEISPRPNFPKVDIEITYVEPADPLIESLEFHVQKVVLPSGLIGWLSSQWASLVEYPGGTIHTLPHAPIESGNELRGYLEDALQRYDSSYGTPNNWVSIFVHGLLESDGVLQWLLDRHNQEYL